MLCRLGRLSEDVPSRPALLRSAANLWASPSAAGPLELTLPILLIVGIILCSVDNVDMVVTVEIDAANFYRSGFL